MKTKTKTKTKKVKTIIFVLVFSLFSLFTGYSQENPQNKPQQNPKENQAQKDKKDEKTKTTPATQTPAQIPASPDEQLQQEIDPNSFIYNPGGRRDPFKNLLQGKEGALDREALEGIAGLTIGELVLEGIMEVGKGKFKAFMKGPKNIPYAVSVGEKVYDGEVAEITPNCIVFKQILTVALSGTKETKVVKWLNPEEEAGK